MDSVVIITFENTHGAIRGEQALLDGGVPVRVMPLPGEIRAGCGICLRVPLEEREKAVSLLAEHTVPIDGMFLRGTAYKAFPPTVLTRALGIAPGDVVSIVGCGGKTSLMHRLAMENRDKTVLLSTTTKIYRPSGEIVDHCPETPSELRQGVNLVFGREENGKLTGPQQLAHWISQAGIALLEADGSKGCPLKGWADHEPVVPDETTVTIGVCTVGPVGRPCNDENTHRPELFRRLTGAVEREDVTLEHIAAMVGAPGGMFTKARGRRILFINQVESSEDILLARQLAALLADYRSGGLERYFFGSVREGTINEYTG